MEMNENFQNFKESLNFSCLFDFSSKNLPGKIRGKNNLSKLIEVFILFQQLFIKNFIALLVEAKQVVPDFLALLESDQPDLLNVGGDKGCTFCGGLGHRITECPKLESVQRMKTNNKKDYLADSAQDY
jgi:hypothetical protein